MSLFHKKEHHHKMEELPEEPPTDPAGIPTFQIEALSSPLPEPGMKEGEVTGIYRVALESVDANLLEKKAAISKAVQVQEHATKQTQKVRAKAARKSR